MLRSAPHTGEVSHSTAAAQLSGAFFGGELLTRCNDSLSYWPGHMEELIYASLADL